MNWFTFKNTQGLELSVNLAVCVCIQWTPEGCDLYDVCSEEAVYHLGKADADRLRRAIDFTC